MNFKKNAFAAVLSTVVATMALSTAMLASAQNIVLKAHDTHPAGYPTFAAKGLFASVWMRPAKPTAPAWPAWVPAWIQ